MRLTIVLLRPPSDQQRESQFLEGRRIRGEALHKLPRGVRRSGEHTRHAEGLEEALYVGGRRVSWLFVASVVNSGL